MPCPAVSKANEQGRVECGVGYDRWQSDAPIALELELAAPNDLRENALNLDSASAIRDERHFLGAGITPGEDLPNDFIVSRTVWRNWTARSSGHGDG